MKFVVDAQLPIRLARYLRGMGHDVVHTLELPEQNSTSDSEIIRLSMEQERVVITKDLDFLESFLIRGEPYKLLLLTTGNIRNSDLEALFQKNLAKIVELLEEHQYIELSQANLTVHQ